MKKVITQEFDIIEADIGSRDADRSGESKYSAPSGYRILGHDITKTGHHSGVSHVETNQPGQLSYSSNVLAELRKNIRDGFVKGVLNNGKGKKNVSATLKYTKFVKIFFANYKFIADTNATIKFKWYLDSKSFDHGASIEAYAKIQLEKHPTEQDAIVAIEAIKFAIESNESKDIYKLIDDVLK